MGIGSRHEHCWYAHYIRSESGRYEFLNGLGSRQQHFTSEMSTFFRRGKLVFKMNTGRTRFNHGFHDLESIQVSAEAGFRIGDQRNKPVNIVFTLRVMNLISTLKGVIDPPNE